MSAHDLRIRSANAGDHPAFARLLPELGVDDPVPYVDRFARDMAPSTLIAERDGSVVGYVYFQLLDGVAYVRGLVSAPTARRTGVGRALLLAAIERARAAGVQSWCLNVKPENVAAITLYESLGLRRAFASKALRIAWSIVEAKAAELPEGVHARLVDAGEEARIEQEAGLIPGQLVRARALDGRVLLVVERDGAVAGAGVFDPGFPGVYPFRVSRPELGLPLLAAARPHARPSGAIVNFVVEGQPEIAEAMLAAGAELRLDIVHMKGALPS